MERGADYGRGKLADVEAHAVTAGRLSARTIAEAARMIGHAARMISGAGR